MQKIVLILIGLTLTCFASGNYGEIGYKEAKRIHSAGSGLFIDARGAKFYKKGTILGAINIPLDRFKRMKRLLPNKQGSKIVIFCNGIECEKSAKLAKMIVDLGYSRVMVYKEGYPQWQKTGQEVMLSEAYCKSVPKIKREVSIENTKVYLGSEKAQ
ncbi:MAG: rhodanese-like domain-containing protein [Sulfurovum sp.]|nr:rhodanese-like domain-containing protein [Sulfurovum sp.]